MLDPRLIARNLLALGVGQMGSRLLAIALAVYLARVLGAATFGAIGIGLTLLRFGAALVAGGTIMLGSRAVARDEAEVPTAYGQVIGFRLVAAAVILVIGVATLPWASGRLGVPANLLLLYLLIMTLEAFALVWLFRGLEKMHTVAGMSITNGVLALLLAVLFVHSADDLLRVPLTHLAATGVVILWAQRWAHRHYQGLRIDLRPAVLRETARESLPVTFSALFLAVNLQGAVLFLGLFASDTTMAGEYLASQRIVLTVFGFTLLLTGATFPATARIMHFARDRVTRLQDQVIRINLLLLMPFVLLGVYYADDIIRLLYGDSFMAAAPVLKIMLWAVPFVVIARGFRQTLMAAAIIQPQLIGTAVSAAVHFVLAWWLIPEWGLRGAAVANISAYVVLALAMFTFVYWKFGDFPLTRRMLGPILATGAGLLALAATDQWHWAIQLSVGLLVYVGTALLTGSVTRSEVNTLLDMLPGTKTGETPEQ